MLRAIFPHLCLTGLLLCLSISPARASQPASALASVQITWPSVSVGTSISGQIRPPSQPSAPLPLVIYLKNLDIPRLGQEPDDSILNDLHAQGYLLLILDYAHNPRAVSPALNADMLKLRNDLSGKARTLLTNYPVDPSHIYILLESFRLKRDVEFARDGKRSLAMDIQYPSHPLHPVPALIEFTCDNANRMGAASLIFCRDTLLDGGMAAGFAVAMADHPVAPPYKGIDDPMPQVIYRCKAAIRTLRSESSELDLNGQIGAIGFSRGGPMAAFLAVTPNRPDLEGDGLHPNISSQIQAALVFGNRYDYSHLPSTDPMYKRFAKAWGPQDQNPQSWSEHGAIAYLPADGHDVAPMFLDTSNAESPEYQQGLAELDQKLSAAHVEHHYQVDADGRGHRMPTDPATLAAIYQFFHQHLDQSPSAH